MRGVRERVVNATQRLTLDRTFEVAVVEAAGVTRSRLDEAEKVLDVTAIRWTPRYWFPVDAGAVARLDQRLAAVREQIGGAHLALVVHGGGGDAKVVRELHRRAGATLGVAVGPTVVVGARWRAATDPSVVWLRVRSFRHDVGGARAAARHCGHKAPVGGAGGRSRGTSALGAGRDRAVG